MRPVLVICGPTASGKTALALSCAEMLGGEVISADAFCVYRGLDIGTAKPTVGERARVRHHLIDVADPRDAFSVSDYERLAVAAAEEIYARGKIPILCGGTGFYMNALLYRRGYGNAPASAEIRSRYEALLAQEGKEALHARLAAVDPASAEKLHPNDTKRVIRALEIYESTGVPKSAQQDGDTPRYPFLAFAYDHPRAELYRRIDARARAMVDGGLLDEVKALLADGVPETAQSMQGIGYKESIEFLKNGNNLCTLSDIIAKNTRNYAKRQLTFFKRMPDLHLLEPGAGAQEVLEIYETYGR